MHSARRSTALHCAALHPHPRFTCWNSRRGGSRNFRVGTFSYMHIKSLMQADISGSYRKPSSCQQECCKALTTPHTCGMCEGGAQLSGHLTSSTKSCFERGSGAWQQNSTHRCVKLLFKCVYALSLSCFLYTLLSVHYGP